VGDGVGFCGGASGDLICGGGFESGSKSETKTKIWSFIVFCFGDQGQALSLFVFDSLTYFLCPSP